MSNKITENLDNILEQVEANLLPENLKKGVSLLGVEGTLEQGTNTSDATATANDIATGKTAYVNGEKIEGNVWDLRSTEDSPMDVELQNTTVQYYPDVNEIYTLVKPDEPIIINEHSSIIGRTNATDLAYDVGLVPELILEGNTILGIEGTAARGTDTSDADATASDILIGKTAYVNGEKITGEIQPRDVISLNGINVTASDSDSTVSIWTPEEDMIVLNPRSIVTMKCPYNSLANAIGVTSNKIVAGNTILGIEGTAPAATSHWFENTDEMNNSVGNNNGDTATVYGNVLTPVEVGVALGEVIFPNVVTFDEPITDSYWPNMNNYGAITANYIYITIDSTTMDLRIGYTDEETGDQEGLCNIVYSSEDGITYTLMDGSGGLVTSIEPYTADFQSCMEIDGSTDGAEYLRAFMRTPTVSFGGLYQFDASATDNSRIQIPYISSIIVTYDGLSAKSTYNGQRTDKSFNKSELSSKIISAINKLGYTSTQISTVYFGLDRDNESKYYVFFVTPAADALDTTKAIYPYNLIYDDSGFLSIATNDKSENTAYTVSLYEFNYDTATLTLVSTLTKTDYCKYGSTYYTLYDIPVNTVPLEITYSTGAVAIGDASYAIYKSGTIASRTSGKLSSKITTLTKTGLYVSLPLS